MSNPSHGPLDLLAYDLDDRVLHARIDLRDDRLADLLVRGEPIPVSEVQLRSLRTQSLEHRAVDVVDPHSLGIVVATGPRGSLRHRRETVSRPVAIVVGRYVVHGFVHAPAPDEPLARLDNRDWLAITEAVLEHHRCGRPWRERFDALLVNRSVTGSIMSIDEATHETHWLAGGPPVAWPDPAIA